MSRFLARVSTRRGMSMRVLVAAYLVIIPSCTAAGGSRRLESPLFNSVDGNATAANMSEEAATAQSPSPTTSRDPSSRAIFPRHPSRGPRPTSQELTTGEKLGLGLGLSGGMLVFSAFLYWQLVIRSRSLVAGSPSAAASSACSDEDPAHVASEDPSYPEYTIAMPPASRSSLHESVANSAGELNDGAQDPVHLEHSHSSSSSAISAAPASDSSSHAGAVVFAAPPQQGRRGAFAGRTGMLMSLLVIPSRRPAAKQNSSGRPP